MGGDGKRQPRAPAIGGGHPGLMLGLSALLFCLHGLGSSLCLFPPCHPCTGHFHVITAPFRRSCPEPCKCVQTVPRRPGVCGIRLRFPTLPPPAADVSPVQNRTIPCAPEEGDFRKHLVLQVSQGCQCEETGQHLKLGRWPGRGAWCLPQGQCPSEDALPAPRSGMGVHGPLACCGYLSRWD